MKIRILTPNDIKQASKIIKANYSRKYEKSAFTEMEAMFQDTLVIKPQYIVAEDKNKIIGLA